MLADSPKRQEATIQRELSKSSDKGNAFNVIKVIFAKIEFLWEVNRLLAPELDWKRLTLLMYSSMNEEKGLEKAMAEVRKMAEFSKNPRVNKYPEPIPSDGQLHNEGRGAGIF